MLFRNYTPRRQQQSENQQHAAGGDQDLACGSLMGKLNQKCVSISLFGRMDQDDTSNQSHDTALRAAKAIERGSPDVELANALGFHHVFISRINSQATFTATSRIPLDFQPIRREESRFQKRKLATLFCNG